MLRDTDDMVKPSVSREENGMKQPLNRLWLIPAPDRRRRRLSAAGGGGPAGGVHGGRTGAYH